MAQRVHKYLYDQYTIDVPGDCAETIQELGEIAINEARERARLYCMPANWTATRISGEVGDNNVRFKVVRKRNNSKRLTPTT
jgi:hypothetical protein